MLFYSTFFLAFLYFKIARVHKKEERLTSLMRIQHLFVGGAIISLLAYGVLYQDLYPFILSAFIFATMASMMITAVQVGIFVDGKPLFGLTQIYRYFIYLAMVILVLTFMLWGIHFSLI